MKSERIFAILLLAIIDSFERVVEMMKEFGKNLHSALGNLSPSFFNQKKNGFKIGIKVILLSLAFIFLTACDIVESLGSEYLAEDNGRIEQVSQEMDGKLKVHYLDVGQGDATFIQLPEGETVLIDGAKRANGQIVLDYLEDLKIEKIDYLLATHPHEDHIGGLVEVVENFEIGEIYLPDKQHTTIVFEDLLLAIKEKGYSIKKAEAGKTLFEEEGLMMNIIAPDAITGSNLNNYSIANQLVYGETTFLFTGDAEKKSEEKMVESHHPLEADVLKVGHHGGDTSSIDSFLAEVRPDYAVISVGEGNQYGHPHPKVLERLRKYDAEIYRIDQEGTIIVTSDGQNISINQKGKDIERAFKKERDQEIEVYRTDTGSKYHRGDCYTLKDTKVAIPLNEAKEEGLIACSICEPAE
ncbi:MAG: MBL fold metallo-hydrolase [Atopostipes suicloacalis]|nr:MBL fold metallo-hydrolase [Atopostipes suicloacalis]